MTQKIKKAVIPAAGLGTRFLPATKAIPKEMIPIIDVPMIQYIVEEAVEAGIEEIILVTARHKEAIENHFDYNYELEDSLIKKGKAELAQISKNIANKCNLISIRQKIPMGLGHAVLAAAPIVGDEPFAILLGDDLVISEKAPCIGQCIDIFNKTETSVVGVMKVQKSEVSKYGIIAGQEVEDKKWKVSGVVEKPAIENAPSQMAIPGRYVLSSRIFDYLKKIKPGKGGEIQLTDALQMLAQNEGLLAYEFEGRRYDTGDRLGYLEATVHFALKRKELRDGFIKIMKEAISSGL